MGVISLGNPIIGRWTTIGGAGFISGISPGLVTVNGAPGSREVEVRHRITRTVVDVVRSKVDGTYLVVGVDPNQEYDVIGRDYAGIYNDAIVSRVRPEPYNVTSAIGAFVVNDVANTLNDAIDIFGGDGHVVSVISGTAPPGITFSVITDGPPTYDYVSRWLIASGATSAGVYSWTLRVTGANGSYIDLACSATFT